MKRNFICLVLLSISWLLSFSQEMVQGQIIRKEKNGTIKSIEFTEPYKSKNYNIPLSSDYFFNYYLNTTSNDKFIKAFHKSKRKGLIHEHYDQFYKDIKVDGAGYNFHFNNGKLFFAHGHYVKIERMETKPSVSKEKAKQNFAFYKGIPNESIISFKAELIIKEIEKVFGIDTVVIPMLVFKVSLRANHQNNNE